MTTLYSLLKKNPNHMFFLNFFCLQLYLHLCALGPNFVMPIYLCNSSKQDFPQHRDLEH